MKKLYKILLQQHLGAPDSPLVKIGDRVERGALIAEPVRLGANIHASVSGTVIDVNEKEIVVEADEVQPDTFQPIPASDSIVEMIKAAGIVGMGGAGFPTHVKMDIDIKGGVVIANGAECEPLLAHNIKQIQENPAVVYRGLIYAMRATNAARGIIAIKSKNTKAIASMKSVIDDARIEVATLPDLYPMGEERAIIREVLGQLLKPEQLPSAANAVVCNVETLAAVCEAVELKKPVMTKNLTVIGRLKSGREANIFMNVPIGTPIKDLIAEAGGIEGDYGEIIMGGPFTGKSVDIDSVVEKTTGGVLVTLPLPKEKRKMGLLVCACGAGEVRLRELAQKMGAEVVSVERCKQVVDVKNSIKCENPGNCPGQAEKVLKLKKNGAEVLLISNCSDCSNTVMGVAPKLKLPVYHHTDHIMRAVGHRLVRRLKIE
ncbi:Electron transport complex protein RnfC [Pelotomaculum schinkii]|uniref:Electron transport complex protein RnfC n=1 Tax=Pelotomaculum schinkii TaxID=78350 RepID=A0A4Y7RCN2_9FIRM|nr:proline reductase-associated electron transfer protein PrdC [Pelotomaculum schinkii]TEB06077.1 Electron transport complex protein RnfC [Pelotomaculum schinkii]